MSFDIRKQNEDGREIRRIWITCNRCNHTSLNSNDFIRHIEVGEATGEKIPDWKDVDHECLDREACNLRRRQQGVFD